MKAKKNAAAEITHTAAETGAAYLADARKRIAPLAAEAKEKGNAYAQQAAVALAPAVSAAKDKARGRYEDVVPKISDALENLANNPNAQEAQYRGMAALQALRGDLTLSRGDRKKLQKAQAEQLKALRKSAQPAKTKKKGGGFVVLLLLGGLGAVGYFLWKKFMAPSDSDWQSHSASAYQPSKPTSSTQSFGEPVDAPGRAGAAAGTTAGTATGTAPANETAAPDVDRSKYGSDAYVGAEPPAGFTIKGNERSMKYHTAGSGGYERTIADVWFTTEDAAEKAGFSKAQR